MLKIFPLLVAFIATISFSGCEQQEARTPFSSDLSGVWSIEKLEQSSLGGNSTRSFQNVALSVSQSEVKISNCKASEEMAFIRDEEYLINNIGGSLRVVANDLIESASVPNVVLLRKTRKSDFFEAGSVSIVSKIYGNLSIDNDVCFQRIVKPDDIADYYHFQLSFPYNNFRMEMDIKYAQLINGKLKNIQSFELTSPLFVDTHNSNTVIATSGELKLISISESSAHFEFDLTALNKKANISNTLLGPSMSGSFQVKY